MGMHDASGSIEWMQVCRQALDSCFTVHPKAKYKHVCCRCWCRCGPRALLQA